MQGKESKKQIAYLTEIHHLLKNVVDHIDKRQKFLFILNHYIDSREKIGSFLNGKEKEELNTKAAVKGFYPPIFDRNIDPSIFYVNYLQIYIEKYVTKLLNIRNVKRFRTL